MLLKIIRNVLLIRDVLLKIIRDVLLNIIRDVWIVAEDNGDVMIVAKYKIGTCC